MESQRYQMLFDLIGQVVNEPNKTADEKALSLIAAAKNYNEEGNLEEFAQYVTSPPQIDSDAQSHVE